ncbi:filamentous hemagglutinin family outer membrane protein [Kalymmatonema gypsitolerans NIES-4073]|nr:filamentous hemagglutinin family outer membrane protein [Scytonema sp. NIES-4073]
MDGFFQKLSRQYLRLLNSLVLCLLGHVNIAEAQIQPDGTLPSNTRVTSNGNTFLIENGTRVGGNLFHSFSEFSVPTGGEAFFNNALDIQNVINRVTGKNISNIDGLIRANGTANLFLINPNGIIFGPNAQLNIGGSFIGSTASSIKFADGSTFSATNPSAPPLLTINVPIGLQFGSNPASIINQSQVTSLIPLPPIDTPIPIPSNVGLQVQPEKTLALVGGDLIFNNGNLTAYQGNILLGSVASPGLVSFIPTPTGLAFDYADIQNFGNIELSGTASVTASGFGGGAIQVRGGSVRLRDRANLISDTIGSLNGRGITIDATQLKLFDQAFVGSATSGTGAGGDIAVRADSVELKGIGFENFIKVFIEPALDGEPDLLRARESESVLSAGTLSAGRSGDITIDTRQLTLQEGSVILTPTFGTGSGGNIFIRASQLVEVNGSGLITTAFNQGNAGNIDIDTGKLIVRDGAIVSATTLNAGQGGNLIVRASDSVVLSTYRENNSFGTSLSTSTLRGTGNAGNLEINTGSVLVEGGATISSASGSATTRNRLIRSSGRGGNVTINASDSVKVIGTSPGTPYIPSQIVTVTLGSADAGDLRINTKQLIVEDGGGVGATTLDTGRGGDIFINASQSVQVSGKTRDSQFPPTGIATASGDRLLTSLYPFNPTAAAGNLSLTTGKLIVQNGATVNVESIGVGNAGTINVVADAIALSNQGSINASTGSGAGGNINLRAQDIRLRGGSRIRTDADSSIGGNININTDTLLAWENSDITANARAGSGGRVSITAQGIFGTQFRNKLTPKSDITATSNLSPQFNGTVELDTGEINPAQGLVQLPENFTQASDGRSSAGYGDRIATGCPADQGNYFIITGRGGLPEDPRQTLRGQIILQDLRLTSGSKLIEEQGRISQSQLIAKNQQPASLVEATGWLINAQGEVELVANTPQVKRSFGNDEIDCGN